MAAINASRVVSFKERKVHQHLEKRFLHKGKSMFWRFIQSPLHWRIVLKIKAWIETLWSNYSGTQYWLTGPEYYSTCGRCSIKDQKHPQHLENHFAMKASQCSSHLYWIKPWIQTFWSNYSGTQYWLTGLNIFPPAEDALPKTRRLLNTWKTGFAMKESQCSGHL